MKDVALNKVVLCKVSKLLIFIYQKIGSKVPVESVCRVGGRVKNYLMLIIIEVGMAMIS